MTEVDRSAPRIHQPTDFYSSPPMGAMRVYRYIAGDGALTMLSSYFVTETIPAIGDTIVAKYQFATINYTIIGIQREHTYVGPHPQHTILYVRINSIV